MDRATALLTDLRNKLQGGWYGPIQRTTRGQLAFAALEGGQPGEFLVRITWVTHATYEKAFTRQYVFGSSFHQGVNAWRVERRACDHARDIMRAALQHVGVV